MKGFKLKKWLDKLFSETVASGQCWNFNWGILQIIYFILIEFIIKILQWLQLLIT